MTEQLVLTAPVPKVKPAPVKITAKLLQAALAYRHGRDVFIQECKTGSTWMSKLRRLDAWAMKKSWAPWTTFGYEIKVTRGDFKGDKKWTEYLDYCHVFYFVCPPEVIQPDDLQPGIGLLWSSTTGNRVTVKVKALRHEPHFEKLSQLMSYVLQSRCRIVRDMFEANRTEEQQAEHEARVASLKRGDGGQLSPAEKHRLAMTEEKPEWETP